VESPAGISGGGQVGDGKVRWQLGELRRELARGTEEKGGGAHELRLTLVMPREGSNGEGHDRRKLATVTASSARKRQRRQHWWSLVKAKATGKAMDGKEEKLGEATPVL
jgi:hypothetical protein